MIIHSAQLLVYRLLNPLGFVAFKMGRRSGLGRTVRAGLAVGGRIRHHFILQLLGSLSVRIKMERDVTDPAAACKCQHSDAI